MQVECSDDGVRHLLQAVKPVVLLHIVSETQSLDIIQSRMGTILRKVKQTRCIEDAVPLSQLQQGTLQFCDFEARFGHNGPPRGMEPIRRCAFCLANEQQCQKLRKLQARVESRPVGALATESQAWRTRDATALVKRRRVARCRFCGRSSV